MDYGNYHGVLGGNHGGLPAGFGVALMANKRALAGYSRMTEAEKEKIILQCKDAKSDQEVERIIGSMDMSDAQGGDLREEIKEERSGTADADQYF